MPLMGVIARLAFAAAVLCAAVLSLSACCVSAFCWSALLRHGKKFDMVDIQNATLAGGVAVGSSADLVIQPWGAVVIGLIAGFLSVFGWVLKPPIMSKQRAVC